MILVTYTAFTLLLMFSVVKSDLDFETMCKNDYRLMNNTQIDVLKFCSSNKITCIEKCCDEGEMIAPLGHCSNINALFLRLRKIAALISEVDYSKIVLWDKYAKKKTGKDYIFIKNQRHPNCTSEQSITNEFFILEDGSVKMQDTGSSNTWFEIRKLAYCIDYKVVVLNNTPQIKLVVKEYKADPAEDYKKSMFVLVGLLISSFFLLLVLVVYLLLPKLQNLIGLVLMAYTASLLVTFLVKIVKHFINNSLTTKQCKIIAPVMYFAAISSFFWLNVMSFDVWWSLRGVRKRRDINRRGERVKFLWYCLYAWGTPLLITAIVTILDNIDLSNFNITKPPFEDFFVSAESVQHYFIIPIGIIIFVNIILFSLTVYNIWMIKRAVSRSQDSRRSSQDTNRFATYIKLSVLMGVSWILELVPADTDLWVFILVNLFNLLVGVAIFFLFVFKKGILIQLCKRFNIKNKFTKSFEVSQASRSGTTRTTRASNTKDQMQEMDLLKNCPTEESVVDKI